MLLVFFAVAFCSASALPYRVVPPKPPASLPAHPRLVLTHERIATVQAMAAVNGSDAAAFLQMLTQHAEWATTQPPVYASAVFIFLFLLFYGLFAFPQYLFLSMRPRREFFFLLLPSPKSQVPI